MTENPWYHPDNAPPFRTWWWAVEHAPQSAEPHPAYFLRALLAGDFHVGGPNPRHVVTLEGDPAPIGSLVECGTCGAIPDPADLEPIERVTGDRGHLHPYRSGSVQWPGPTRPESCWLCSSPQNLAPHRRPRGDLVERADGLDVVNLCDACEAFVVRWGKAHPGPHLLTGKS